MRTPSSIAALTLIATFLFAPPADACHGPGTAAGGVQVWSARPIARGALAALLRADYTQFESLSANEIEQKTLAVSGDHAHFHVVGQSTLITLGLQYGLTDNLAVGVLLGYYAATDVGEGHAIGSSYEFYDYGDVDGLADTWVEATWRVRAAPSGDVAVIGAVKAPTGKDDIVFDDARIDQSLQPGSGSWDASLAVAFTRDLGQRVTLDASAQYILRTEALDYRVGDQFNAGLAVATRLLGDMHSDRTLSGFVEMDVRNLAENEQAGEPHVNSGGTTLFVTPGLHADLSPHAGAAVGWQLPLVQKLNDVQQEVDYKITGSVTVTF